MISEAVKRYVRENKTRVFRRAYIKRMQTDGTFESDWFEITKDVKRFGRVAQSIDSERYNKIAFRSMNITVNNSDGRYLDESDERSLWWEYASQQRTLVKIEAGYTRSTLTSEGIYHTSESPGAYWDVAYWDDPADTFDTRPVSFTGLLTGDISFSSNYEVNLNIMPILEIFRTYPSTALSGFTSTGITASKFCEILRDQTDGGGNYVFRPFLGDTTGNWNIATTTEVYSQLNTSTSKDLINTNVWDVLEKLAEAEDFVVFITNDGFFNFKSRDSNTTTAAFEFFGLGVPSREWGHTIKAIQKFGRSYSKYYSRVSVQFRSDDTTSSYQIVESSLAVNGTNGPWLYGHRTLQISNYWISGATQAAAIAQNVFENVTSLKREIHFSTCFIPGLNVLDRINVSYDPSIANPESLWDTNNWADSAGAAMVADELIWDSSRGDSFYLNGEEMNIISVELDLDKLENKIVARET